MTAGLTHDQVAAAALGWLLGQPWASVGCTELAVSFGRLDVVAISNDLDHEQRWHRVTWLDHAGRRQAQGQRPKSGKRWPPPAPKPPMIAVAEAKATRADLLQDLRASKSAEYGHLAGKAYFAVSPEALLLRRADPMLPWATKRGLPAREAAKALDLPDGWGLLLVTGLQNVTCLRSARKLRDVSTSETAALRAAIGRALSFRAARAAGVLAAR
jgi:hypothetical protein